MAEHRDVLGILSGGTSPESDISLSSGRHLAHLLRSHGHRCDLIVLTENPVPALLEANVDGFIVAMHGGWGEDGRLQSVLDIIGAPYSGSRPRASMLAMHKGLSKQVFRAAGVPTPDGRLLRSPGDIAAVRARLSPPWVVKPVDSGSSLGVCVVAEDEAEEVIASALGSFGELLVEEFVAGKILTVAVLDVPSGLRVLEPLEIRPHGGAIYDERTKSLGLRTYGRPELDDAARQRTMDAAAAAHAALGCSGITRVDCIHSDELGPVILEVNTIPGMEPTGNLLQCCAAAGVGEAEFAAMLIESVR